MKLFDKLHSDFLQNKGELKQCILGSLHMSVSSQQASYTVYGYQNKRNCEKLNCIAVLVFQNL